MAEENSVVCPHCGRSESVARVSIVYEKALTSAISRALVKTLAPPKKPLFDFIEKTWRENRANRAGSTPIWIRLFFSLFLAALLVPITLVIFGAIVVTARFEFKDLVLPVVGVGLLLFFISYGEDSRRVVIINGDDLRTNWEKAMRRWKALYYCPRCVGVFLPGQEQWSPVRKMKTFFYR